MMTLSPTSSSIDAASSESTSELCKAVVFMILGYRLALPVESIFKVIQVPRSPQDSIEDESVFLFNEQPLTVLDLHHQLAKAKTSRFVNPETPVNDPAHFLIITQMSPGKLCGIPVDTPPSLQEISLSTIHLLPPSYRQALFNLASHIAVLPKKESSQTIFLLDLQQALALLKTTPTSITANAEETLTINI